MLVLAVHHLVVDEHAGRCDQVGQNSATDVAQSILVEKSPWGVGGSQENGLGNMASVPASEQRTNPSCKTRLTWSEAEACPSSSVCRLPSRGARSSTRSMAQVERKLGKE